MRVADQKPKGERETKPASLIAHPFLSVAVAIALAVIGWVFFTPSGSDGGGRVAEMPITEPPNPAPNELGGDPGPPGDRHGRSFTAISWRSVGQEAGSR